MKKLEELRQFIKEYRQLESKAKKLGGYGFHYSDKFQFGGMTIYEFSKEIGIPAKLKEYDSFNNPFEIVLNIDGFELFGLLSWKEVRDNNLVDKCPMCGSKV